MYTYFSEGLYKAKKVTIDVEIHVLNAQSSRQSKDFEYIILLLFVLSYPIFFYR